MSPQTVTGVDTGWIFDSNHASRQSFDSVFALYLFKKKYLHDIVMDSEASEGGKGKSDKDKGG